MPYEGDMKTAFAKRKKDLYKKYISKLNTVSAVEKTRLWNEYKKQYYKEVCDNK